MGYIQEAIEKLEGIQCGNKGTSCPDQFAKALKEAMMDPKKSVIVSTLLNYNSSDNLSHECIQGDPSFTVKALYRLGYRWPITDFDYLIRAIKSLDSLDFFDRTDM